MYENKNQSDGAIYTNNYKENDKQPDWTGKVEMSREMLKELVNKLKLENIKVLAIEQAENSTKLNTFYPKENQKYAVIMGNEVKGVQQDVVNASDLCIEIPQLGTKHSLNISVTTGVVLWDLFQKIYQ